MTAPSGDILSLVDEEYHSSLCAVSIIDDSCGSIRVLENNILSVEGKVVLKVPFNFVMLSEDSLICDFSQSSDVCQVYTGQYSFIRTADIQIESA